MKKYFTISEANRALKLIEPVVKDVLAKMSEAQRLHAEVKNEKMGSSASETALMSKLERAEKLLNEVEYHMDELASVGVEMKDVRLGAIDFPCLRDGRIIFLCWIFGEKSVSFWHEQFEGLTDRKPIDVNEFQIANLK